MLHSDETRARFRDRSAGDLPHTAAIARGGGASIGDGGVASVDRVAGAILPCRASRLTPDEAAKTVADQRAAAGAWRVVFDAAAEVRVDDRLTVTGKRLGTAGPPFTVTLDVVAIDDVRAGLASLQVTAVDVFGAPDAPEAA